MKTKNTSISLCALSLVIKPVDNRAPTEIQLTPAGTFSATDGRPHEVPTRAWLIDDDIAARVIAATTKIQNKLVIDYEHQTLLKEKNGQPAPAAGWFMGSHLEYRNNGLWATHIEWTPKAEQMILSGEYRYISPVFEYDPATGEVTRIRMVALTNSPAVDGMQPIASLTNEQLHQQLNQQLNQQHNPFNDRHQEEPMWKQLLAQLGLPETATEKEALAALSAIQTQAEEANTQVAALTEKVNANPDPAQFVPVTVMQDLQGQIAALTAQQNQNMVEQTVNKALADGKLLPSQRDWAVGLGNAHMASLTEYLDSAKPIAALAQQQSTQENPPEHTKTAALTEDQKLIAAAFGKTEQEFKQSLELEQGA